MTSTDPAIIRAMREDAEALETPAKPRAPCGWWIIPGAVLGLIAWGALAWWIIATKGTHDG